MLGHRELQLDDYLTILRRRMWWIIVPTVIVPVLTYLAALRLPNRYVSQTLVLVEQQKVPDSFVKPVVTEDLNARLATMQEQILSRTRLQPIVERLALYAKNNGSMEDKVARMRTAIEITPVKSEMTSNTGGLPGFYISFTADSPQLAQQVCSEILSMFMSENIRDREQTAQGTTDFLKNELENAKRTLDDRDRNLAEFKQKYVGQLPGQEQTSLSMLGSLNSQLDAVNQALSRAQQDKAYMESLLAQQLAAWHASQSSNNPQDLDQQISILQAQLVQLEAKYTSNHPDVVKTEAAIRQLKKKLGETESTVNDKPTNKNPALMEPDAIRQQRLTIHQLEQNIREKTAQQVQLQKSSSVYQARVQLSPVVEEQYKKLTRDYEMAQKFYDELLSKTSQSEMATNLERRQQGERFRVMDRPNRPEKPTFPNRPLFALEGLGGGFGFGVLLAFVLELRDKSIRTERDVEFYLGLPTLGLIPVVDGTNGTSGRRMNILMTAKNRKAHVQQTTKV